MVAQRGFIAGEKPSRRAASCLWRWERGLPAALRVGPPGGLLRVLTPKAAHGRSSPFTALLFDTPLIWEHVFGKMD